MTFDTPLIPGQLTLEIQSTRELPAFSTADARWRAYLNQVSLEAFLSWVTEQYPSARVWP